MTQSGLAIIKTVQVTSGDTGPNASIWSSEPMLEKGPGQHYCGRVVIEVWDEGEFIFFPTDPYRLDQALMTLRKIDGQKVSSVTPWSNEPVMGELPEQTFRGRVVVELWDNHTAVAITGIDTPKNLAGRAANRISFQRQNGRWNQ